MTVKCRLTAVIFLCALCLCSFACAEEGILNAADADQAYMPAGSMVVEQAVSPLDGSNTEDIVPVFSKTIDIKKTKVFVTKFNPRIVYPNTAKKASSGISIKNSAVMAAAPALKKSNYGFKKAKVRAQSSSSSAAVTDKKSKDLLRLKKVDEKRRSEFKKSLESRPDREARFLKSAGKGTVIKKK